MYKFLFVHASKLAVIICAALAGEGVALFDAASNHTSVTAILAGIAAALVVKYVDKWLEGRNKTIKTGDKILEIETAEKKAIRESEAADKKAIKEEQQRLLAEKEAWWKLQNDRLAANNFEIETRYRSNIKEAREINHGAINQIMAQQNIILGMQRTLMLQGLPIPEVSILELTKFMLPAWESERDEQNKLESNTAMDNC